MNGPFFLIQVLKTQLGFDKDLSMLYPKTTSPTMQRSKKYTKLQVASWAKRVRDNALIKHSHLSKANNINIQNPTFDTNKTKKTQPLPDKMVALIHFGRSGTGLMHSLIDGHPEVSTLPSIYFSEYFDHSIWAKIISAGWDGMADRFISIYDVLFDASSSVPVATKSTKLLHNIGIEEGMANVGDQRNEILRVDKIRFRTELKRLMDYKNLMLCLN